MERLTEKHFGREDHYMKCSETCANDSEMCGGCPYLDKLVERLAAYEDTGLEPEEIMAAFQNSYTAAEIEDIQNEAYDLDVDSVLRNHFDIPWADAADIRKNIDHLRDLVKAEKEGRLVVLPYPPRPMLKDRNPFNTDVYCPECGTNLSGYYGDNPLPIVTCFNCGEILDPGKATTRVYGGREDGT